MPGSGSQHGHKKRRPSFWGCRPPGSGPRSTGKSRESRDSRVQNSDEPISNTNSASSRHPSISFASQRQHSDRKKKVSIDVDLAGGSWANPIQPETMDYDGFPTRSSRFTMRPFGHLVSRVKHCPWMLGSDVHPFAASTAADETFFPPVPRSLLHDTAVSFVVTDHTRVEQPQFVISCPLENVELVQRLLAPEGSRRQLSARGSSRQPRNADQLRSMLLDGTPNIELSLHWSPGTASSVGRSGPGGWNPFDHGERFDFQANLFPRRHESNPGDVAERRGQPSEGGSNSGAGASARAIDGGNGGPGSGGNEHILSGWDAYGT